MLVVKDGPVLPPKMPLGDAASRALLFVLSNCDRLMDGLRSLAG